MHIGLTYDLRREYRAAGWSEEQTAEFDRDDTIDAIEGALEALGHGVERIGHARQLIRRLATGDRWDLVFNICEGLSGPAREAQVPAILDTFGIPYTFSDPLVMSLALDKALTKIVLREAGIPTPPFAVVRDACDLAGIDLDLPLFVKPLAEGTGKGIDPRSVIRRQAALGPACQRLLDRFRQPVLVETFLPGREMTVGLVGSGRRAEVIGTLEIRLRRGAEADVYSYHNKECCEELVEYRPVSAAADAAVAQAERIALEAWRRIGGRDAGRVDLRADAREQLQVLEVNPLSGLHPQHSDLPMLCTARGISYVELIGRIVASAAERMAAPCAQDQPVDAQG